MSRWIWAVVLAAAICASCGSSAASLPSLAKGCSVVKSRPASVDLPFAVSGAHGHVPVVSVCIGGHGPYPFVVSTGSGVSVVSPALSRSLGLKTVIPLGSVLGVTCVPTASAAVATRWSMAGLDLAPQVLFVASVPEAGLSPPPVGVIGSDVLSRFQAVRFDYRSRHLRTLGYEQLPPTSTAFEVGTGTAPAPAVLQRGPARATVPLTVLNGPSGTLATAPVSFGGAAPVTFAVDTGADQSSVAGPVAQGAGLVAASDRAPTWGVGCSGSAAGVSSGSWSLGMSHLASRTLSERSAETGVNRSVEGVLGSDVLASWGSFVLDYDSGQLWLGGQ